MCKVRFGSLEDIEGNYRYKLLKVDEEQYYVDFDCNPIFPIFPFLVFFLPVVAYKLQTGSKINTISHKNISIMAVTGISVAGSRIINRFREYTTIAWDSSIKILIILLVVALILILRILLQKKKKKKLRFERQVKIIVKPCNMSKRIALVLLFCFFYSVLSVAIVLIFTNSDILFFGIWCFLFYLFTNFNYFLMKTGNYEIKFLGDE